MRDSKNLIERAAQGLYWFVHEHERGLDGERGWKRWTGAYANMVERQAEDQLRRLAPPLLGAGSDAMVERRDEAIDAGIGRVAAALDQLIAAGSGRAGNSVPLAKDACAPVMRALWATLPRRTTSLCSRFTGSLPAGDRRPAHANCPATGTAERASPTTFPRGPGQDDAAASRPDGTTAAAWSPADAPDV